MAVSAWWLEPRAQTYLSTPLFSTHRRAIDRSSEQRSSAREEGFAWEPAKEEVVLEQLICGTTFQCKEAMNESPSRLLHRPYTSTSPRQAARSMSAHELIQRYENMSAHHGDVVVEPQQPPKDQLQQGNFVRPRRRRESSSGSRSEGRSMEVQRLENKYSPKKEQWGGANQTRVPVNESYCVLLTPPTRRVKSTMDIRPPITIVDSGYDHIQQNQQKGGEKEQQDEVNDNHLGAANTGESSLSNISKMAHPPLTVDSGVCQCCYDEVTTTTLTCYNEQTPHPICNSCVTSFVREWLHGGNRNGVIHSDSINNNNRIPCLCSSDVQCTSFVAVGDWNTILTRAEIKQLDDRLTNDRNIRVRRSSSNSELRRDVAPRTSSAHAPTRNSLVRRSYDNIWEDSQHEIEELRTRARLRSCPTCDKTFLKESGCNKVTCPNCLTSICYCCRKIVSAQGYDHFYVEGKDDLQQKLNRCPLWTDDNGDKRLEKKFIKDSIYRMAQEMRQYA